MWKRTLLVAALAIALATLAAPASLMDTLLSNATDGRLRLMHTSGTLWHGKGDFVSLAPDGRSAQPWLAGSWGSELDPASAGIAWRLEEAGQIVLRLALGPRGISISRAALDTPLRALLDSLPSPIARAGWRGVLRVESEGIDCDWERACRGTAQLTWLDAGVDLLPQQRFGDYEVLARAAGHDGRFEVRTIGGEVRIGGQGGWNTDGRPYFHGEVSGPEAIVGRLPNVMDGYAFATGDSGRVSIEFD
ncbi:MAG: type II secretion system protein N [Rhodocyclaceae bacterium]|nr:type II secretion system protein N [Rhodocyclaceae bacterium]MCW5617597.1 type II secretion system protein N [Rhodocyclaceae bacterium]